MSPTAAAAASVPGCWMAEPPAVNFRLSHPRMPGKPTRPPAASTWASFPPSNVDISGSAPEAAATMTPSTATTPTATSPVARRAPFDASRPGTRSASSKLFTSAAACVCLGPEDPPATPKSAACRDEESAL